MPLRYVVCFHLVNWAVSTAPTSTVRWQAPAAHCVALHALVCLLRAVEVDACGQKADAPDTGEAPSDCRQGLGARGVATEKGVLLLVLKACDVFNAQAQVVTTCCMLMRIGVRYSEQDEGDEQSKVRFFLSGVVDVLGWAGFGSA